MNTLSTLMTAIAALMTAFAGVGTLVITARKERRRSADAVLRELRDAAQDGDVSSADLLKILIDTVDDDE